MMNKKREMGMKNVREINLEDEVKTAALAYCQQIKRLCYQIESRGDELLENDELLTVLNEIRNDSRFKFKLPERVRAYPYVCGCGVIWNKFPRGIGVVPSIPSNIKPCEACDDEMYERACEKESDERGLLK